MPFRRTYRRRPGYRRTFRRRRNVAGLATRPRMMSSALSMKRRNQVSTKVFWFKRNGVIQSNPAGNNYSFWRTREINNPEPIGWAAVKTLYDQYKVLAMKLKFFPANVGVEPDSALFASNALLRGDTAVWSDQRWAPNSPQQISEIINNASTKMINSRRPYARTIYRPRGEPEWGDTQSPTPDSWDGSVELIINNASPAPATGTPPVLWYWTLQYKVVVRGRRQV